MFDKYYSFFVLLIMAIIAASFGETTDYAIFVTGALVIAGLDERDAH